MRQILSPPFLPWSAERPRDVGVYWLQRQRCGGLSLALVGFEGSELVVIYGNGYKEPLSSVAFGTRFAGPATGPCPAARREPEGMLGVFGTLNLDAIMSWASSVMPPGYQLMLAVEKSKERDLFQSVLCEAPDGESVDGEAATLQEMVFDVATWAATRELIKTRPKDAANDA